MSEDDEPGFFGKMAGIGGIRGPLERSLYGEESPLEMGRRYTEAERREARQCRDAFDKGDYEQAIKVGKKTAKKFKESSLGEEAQFYIAESYYAQGKFSKAQDGYDQLFEDYPSTRYVEPATRKLYRIARIWLEVAEPVAKNEIRQVSGEKVIEDETPAKPPLDPTLRVRVLPNFHDRSRPMFDTQGRALECLKSIWMNDPTGPLADDSLMLTATYYQRHDNYVEVRSLLRNPARRVSRQSASGRSVPPGCSCQANELPGAVLRRARAHRGQKTQRADLAALPGIASASAAPQRS
jgi:tetratricopeptide (TPR) repeat protein